MRLMQIGETSFEEAASLITSYSGLSALVLHLGLDRPSIQPPSDSRNKGVVLVWGVSSSFGATAAQFARDAGYAVVGVASARNEELARASGVTHFVDRHSPTVVDELVALGPFKAVLAAADSAEDQVKIGAVLAAHGGGYVLVDDGSPRRSQASRGSDRLLPTVSGRLPQARE